MGENYISPVARFSPAPGLFVDRTEKSVAISGAMELYGPEATAARAQSIEHSINSTWTSVFPDGYSVSCKITVTYRSEGASSGKAAPIEAVKIAGPSHVSSIDRSMTLNANETDAFTWTPAHEFGHVIGLKDRYFEGIMSKIKGKFGGTRTTTVDPRYQANLMAIDGGVLESQNVGDLALENQPSPYWVNDDDQVRDWVNHHNSAEVGLLSTTNKINMIKTLMGGWISDEDVDAIRRICSSVTLKKEADAIRNSIDLLTFTSIGQRTSVRVAFASMP
jgi:hypothetical protein